MSIVDRSNAGAYLRKLGLEKAEFIITDLEELDIYENAADLLSQNADTPEFIDLVSQMRFNSAKKISAQKTKNIPFLEECFEHFVKNGRWNFAQLVSFKLSSIDMVKLTPLRLAAFSQRLILRMLSGYTGLQFV